MNKIAGAAALMATSSAFGIAINFAIQAFLAYHFGAGTSMDAYVAAMTVPALLTAVFVPGLSIVLIPVFVEAQQKRGNTAAWRTASTLLNVTAICLTALVAIAIVFAGPMMRLIVPGLDASATTLAVSLVRWLLPAAIVSVVAGAIAGLEQAYERFWATAVSPLVASAVLLGIAIAFAPAYGMRAVAAGTLAGTVCQLLVVLPVLRGGYRPLLDLHDRDLHRVGLLLAPLIIGGLVYRATVVADRYVASLLPKGSLSHLEYASRIAAVINALFSTGVASALYPRMSGYAAADDLPSLSNSLVWGQRLLMLILFPALAIGWVLRVPLLQLVLQRGHFMAADTQAVAAIVSWFMLGVVGGALGLLQARVYYVLKDTLTPAILGVAETALYFTYLPLLAREYGAVGVGVGNAIYLLSAMVVNGVVVLRRLRTATSWGLLFAGARTALLASIAGAGAWVVATRLHGVMAVLAGGTVAGIVMYGILLLIVRPRELHVLRSLIAREGREV